MFTISVRIHLLKVVIHLFCNEDIGNFLSLAADEGWISDAWEVEFLRKNFPAGCLACRNKGIPVAFLTSIKYELSGWIGNLIVRKEWRGQGLGSALLDRALEVLDEAGVQTVWLTASASGRPLYERRGFTAIDTVNRWQGAGRILAGDRNGNFCRIMALDEAGWGDRRESLIRATLERGSVSILPGGFLVRQSCGDATQIGPWCSRNPRSAASLLERAIVPTTGGSHVFLDVPEENRHASKLLGETGFAIQSSSTLMYRGEKPDYAPERIYALASMGSMG